MAERIVRQLIDDMDGSEISEGSGQRIEFSVRGLSYQIDLSSVNVAKFDKALKPFVEAAAKIRGSRSRAANASASKGAASKEHLAAIRDWARKNGHEVSDRGRIKAEILEAFESAH